MTNMWSLSQSKHPNLQCLNKDLIPPSIINILENRGFSSVEGILDYLRPSLFDLHSPFLFKDMQKIILRLEKALNSSEKILVYGDYDADGVTGTALIFKVLKNFGFNVIVHIPNREEGYGLHKDIILKAAENNVTLIITIDCGITAVEETQLALSHGVDVIITDHHEPPELLPSVVGILNPKMDDSGYPFKHLAGVGVAYKLVQALFTHFNLPLEIVGTEREYLDLVALGTIADIVPLVGENRIIAKYGLKVMENTKHFGIRAILDECGLSGKKLKAGQMSFIVAPRINAAGRMDTARLALNLFLEEEYESALDIAKELSRENYQRQLTERAIFQDAEETLTKGPLPEVIVLSSPNWHHGVIGIVASRLVERFQRPVYLISEEGEIGKGSARGIPDYHVLEELTKQSSLLSKFGGHKQAAGFTLATNNIEPFREGLNRSFVDSGLNYKEHFIIDSVIPCQEIELNLPKELEQMAPFGVGNPAPLLMTNRLTIKKILPLGKEGEHLKLILESDNQMLEALAFKKGNELEQLKNMEIIDIIYSLEVNNYYGEEKIQAILKDYRQSCGDSLSEVACSEDELDLIVKENPYVSEIDGKELTRQMLVELYRDLRGMAEGTNLIYWNPNIDNQLDIRKRMHIVRIFEELGLVSWLGGAGPFLLRLNREKKADLQSSLRFRMLS